MLNLNKENLPKEIEALLNVLLKEPKAKLETIFDLPEFKALPEEHKAVILKLLTDFLTSKTSNPDVDFDSIEKRLHLFSKTCFELVPDMLRLNKDNFAIFLACISSILSDIWEDKIDMKSLASGMHHLMIMHVSEGNRKAQLASNMFNELQSIND